MLIKHEFPILEYDTQQTGVIMPARHNRYMLPKLCLLTFFGDVLDEFIEKSGAVSTLIYKSEMRNFPIYEATYKNLAICLVQAPVGSASIATMTDYLIGHGVKNIIACGACGVLDEIPAGDVIIPIAALRDEGASYHYLPPSRVVTLNEHAIKCIEKTLQAYHTPYVKCMTWTTDGFYRETPDMISYRREEGCKAVEMECATIAAVAEFRRIQFGQLLYSGDILTDYKNYDERNWSDNLTAREKLFFLSLESLCCMGQD